MNIGLIKAELINEKLLKEIIYFEELSSTNDYAKKNNCASDTLIITSYQTDGKGRFNRQWITSPSKDLTFSIVKSFKITIDEIHLINFYSSYILFDSIKKYFNDISEHEFLLKWPNDILLNGKKIAGLLLDVKDLNSEIKKFIIGIGVNINGTGFAVIPGTKATSLSLEMKEETETEKILVLFIKNFYENLHLLKRKSELMKNWAANTSIIGKTISFRKVSDDAEQSVTVVNIDTDGGLKVITKEGKSAKYYSGEISISYK